MTDGFDSAAAAGFGHHRIGLLGLILAPYHKVLVLEVTYILITQILHIRQTVRDRLISFVMALDSVMSNSCVAHVYVVWPQKAWGQ